jgi:hypothetical protein
MGGVRVLVTFPRKTFKARPPWIHEVIPVRSDSRDPLITFIREWMQRNSGKHFPFALVMRLDGTLTSVFEALEDMASLFRAKDNRQTDLEWILNLAEMESDSLRPLQLPWLTASQIAEFRRCSPIQRSALVYLAIGEEWTLALATRVTSELVLVPVALMGDTVFVRDTESGVERAWCDSGLECLETIITRRNAFLNSKRLSARSLLHSVANGDQADTIRLFSGKDDKIQSLLVDRLEHIAALYSHLVCALQ